MSQVFVNDLHALGKKCVLHTQCPVCVGAAESAIQLLCSLPFLNLPLWSQYTHLQLLCFPSSWWTFPPLETWCDHKCLCTRVCLYLIQETGEEAPHPVGMICACSEFCGKHSPCPAALTGDHLDGQSQPSCPSLGLEAVPQGACILRDEAGKAASTPLPSRERERTTSAVCMVQSRSWGVGGPGRSGCLEVGRKAGLCADPSAKVTTPKPRQGLPCPQPLTWYSLLF